MTEPHAASPATLDPRPNWGDLLCGVNLVRSLALSGGVALHAINLYLSTTILPSAVKEIGGLDYYAWNTTVFVVASIVGAALSSRLLADVGPRLSYSVAALIFAIGSVMCAVSPSMFVMLAGRFVQGLGGGALLALPYAMILRVFAEPLWPRALALLSSMWGVATLLGPAIGGVFAEFDMWRAAFWSLIPAAALFTLAAFFVLPHGTSSHDTRSPLPMTQLSLLTLAVLAASCGSVGAGTLWTASGILIAVALITALIAIESRAPNRLLPRGTFSGSSSLGAYYAMSGLLAVTVTCTEVFLPLFLQELHGKTPLQAGYIAAVMSAGWTAGAIFSAGLRDSHKPLSMHAGAMLSLAAMLALAALMPSLDGPGEWQQLALICVVLLIGGLAVGLAYPHLSARVLEEAPTGDEDHAAAAIMTVQLCATAFGAALAGLTVNLAGTRLGSHEMDIALSARWLFAVVAIAPALCIILMRSRHLPKIRLPPHIPQSSPD